VGQTELMEKQQKIKENKLIGGW